MCTTQIFVGSLTDSRRSRPLIPGAVTQSLVLPQPPTHTQRLLATETVAGGFGSAAMSGRIWGTRSRHEDGESS